MDDTGKTSNAEPLDDRSASKFLSMVYNELRRMAYSQMSLESAYHTLQPTALVHEAWLKMIKEKDRTWHNRAHFLCMASTAMRRILVDHARQKLSLKRGGDKQRLDIDLVDLTNPLPDEKILAIEEALERLEKEHPQWANIVVMKYFGGMLNMEIAEALGIGERSVERYWACARAWLYKHIQQ